MWPAVTLISSQDSEIASGYGRFGTHDGPDNPAGNLGVGAELILKSIYRTNYKIMIIIFIETYVISSKY